MFEEFSFFKARIAAEEAAAKNVAEKTPAKKAAEEATSIKNTV